MLRCSYKKISLYFLTVLLAVGCILILFAVDGMASEYSGIDTDAVLNEGDVLSDPTIVYIDGSNNPDGITVAVNGKIQVKTSIAVKGKVKITGSNNAEFIADEELIALSKCLVSVNPTNGVLTLENIKISSNNNADKLRFGLVNVQSKASKRGILNIESGVIIDADSENNTAINNGGGIINVNSRPKVRGKVPEGVEFDPYIPEAGNEERKLGASIASSATDFVFKGDTFTVTVGMLPDKTLDKTLKLASGQLELSYDPGIFSVVGTSLGETLSGLGEQYAAVTAENGKCTVHFNTPEDAPVKVPKKGLELATVTFSADRITENPASFAVTAVTGKAPESNIDIQELTPYPSLSMSVTVPTAVCEQYGSDYKIIKYVADSLPESGKSYFIGDKEMTYVKAYSQEGSFAFVCLSTSVPDNLGLEIKDITRLKEGGTETETEVLKLEHASGDINMSGATDIVDAQIVVYMIANKVTSETESIDWLNSDVNGDETINALDYQAIQHYVHYKSFG